MTIIVLDFESHEQLAIPLREDSNIVNKNLTTEYINFYISCCNTMNSIKVPYNSLIL